MRCVPIPLIYHLHPSLAQEYAAAASSPTHPHPTCTQACQLYTHLITYLTHNGTTIEAKSELWHALEGFDDTRHGGFGTGGHVTPALVGALGRYGSLDAFMRVKEEDVRSSGFVVDTLVAALWAFFTTETFREGALRVVNLGDDADTVGAVYGGLAGAWYGVDAIPVEWVDGLQAKGMVDEVVEGVVRLVETGGYGPES